MVYVNNFVEKTDKVYDIRQLKAEADHYYKKFRGELDHGNVNALGIRRRKQDSDIEGLKLGSGSLWNEQLDKPFEYEDAFTEYNGLFRGSYIEYVVKDLEQYAREKYNLKISRARLNRMNPKSCLTYHRDVGNSLRFHVPIETNPGVFFIHEGSHVSQMLEEGAMYLFDSVSAHTVANASRKVRNHLVVVCYTDEDCRKLREQHEIKIISPLLD